MLYVYIYMLYVYIYVYTYILASLLEKPGVLPAAKLSELKPEMVLEKKVVRQTCVVVLTCLSNGQVDRLTCKRSDLVNTRDL
jgi:hypothetical protein